MRSISTTSPARVDLALWSSGRSASHMCRLARSKTVAIAERPAAPMIRSPSRWPTSVRPAAAGGREAIGLNWPRGDFAGSCSPFCLAPLPAASAPVQPGMQSLGQPGPAVGVDADVDGLAADSGGAHPQIDTLGQLDGDSHRRVLGPQPGRHMGGQIGAGHQDRRLRSGPLRVSPPLGGHRPIVAASTVSLYLGGDGATVAVQPDGNGRDRPAPLEPGPNLLAFEQSQRHCWHDGCSTGRGLGKNSGHHARAHAPTGGPSALNCSRHPLNSPSVEQINHSLENSIYGY